MTLMLWLPSDRLHIRILRNNDLDGTLPVELSALTAVIEM
jgi:hypothetical protein